MFDYRFARNAEEYTAQLRQEALNDRLARSVNPSLAVLAARVFRAWAARLERAGHEAERTGPAAWAVDEERREALTRRRRHPYAGSEL